MQNSRFFFALLAVCAAIGIGSIWAYPYFSINNTGLFIIPYLIALIVLGIPLLMLEFSIGQYFGTNVVDIFSSVKKWFSFIGWLMLINAFIATSIAAVMLAWAILYLFTSFGLQWEGNASGYFLNNITQASNGINGFTHLSLPVFIALIFSWVIIFFFIRKGYETAKKTFLAGSTVLAALLIFLFFYSLSLDNALEGAYAMLNPDFSGLADLGLWIAAFYTAIISLGISFGIMPVISRKLEKGFITGNSFIVAFSELIASIAIGLIIAGFIGFLSLKKSVGLEKIVSADYSSTFTILADAFPFLGSGTLISLIFFLFIGIILIFASAMLAYAISHVIVHKFKTKHISASILVCGLGFLSGLIFVVKPGMYIMDMASHFISYNILIVVLLEAVAIGWFFNSEKISDFINNSSSLKLGNIWKLMIRFVIPLIVFLIIIFQLKTDLASNYKDYPTWALLVFGLGTIAIPMLIAFLMPQKIWDRR